MYLPDIQSGTRLTITFEDKSELTANFLNSVDHIKFLIQNSDISENIDQYTGSSVSVKFFARDSNYTFTCKITGLETGKTDTIKCLATSLFKKISLRADFRINTSLKAKVFSYTDNEKGLQLGELICEARTADLSRTGVRLWSDTLINAPLQTMFVVELTLRHSNTCILTAKLVRSQSNHSIRSYNFDYGFVFPANMHERAEKLILDVITLKLNSDR